MELSRRLRLIGVFSILSMLVGVLTLSISLSWQYALAFTHLPCDGDRTHFTSLEHNPSAHQFTGATGDQLRGWFLRGSRFPDIAIIVLPGAAQNTQFSLEDSQLLAEAGFGILVYEHRVCANQANLHSGGYLEAADLIQAVESLKSGYQIDQIGVLGFSTGGSTGLLAAARNVDIEAVLAMGGFSSLEQDVLDPGQDHGLFDLLTRRLILLIIGQQLKIDPSEVSPITQVQAISPRPLLLIYGDAEAEHGEALYAAAGQTKELWIVPGAGHGGYRETAHAEYEKRVVEFFLAAFGLPQEPSQLSIEQ